MQNLRERVFPSRGVCKRPPRPDVEEFQGKCNVLRRLAADQERNNPVSFAIENSWTATLKSDKQHYLEYIEYITRRMT